MYVAEVFPERKLRRAFSHPHAVSVTGFRRVRKTDRVPSHGIPGWQDFEGNNHQRRARWPSIAGRDCEAGCGALDVAHHS